MPNKALSKNKEQEYLSLINYQPLFLKVSPKQLVAEIKIDTAGNIFKIVYIGSSLLIVITLLICASIIVLAIEKELSVNVNTLLAILMFFFAACCLLIYDYIKKVSKRFRMRQFAYNNNLKFVQNIANPSYSGLVFNLDDSSLINYAYNFSDLYNAQIGNYTYWYGNGSKRQSSTIGFIKLDLPRRLPHMLLDSNKNNYYGKVSNLPITFNNEQKLSLEGNFNDYFTLYAPKEYETDALYIFTPDVMQAIIDTSKNFDIEIVDNQLFLYSQTEFKLHSESEIKLLLQIITILAKQFYEQADYYADSKVGNRQLDIIAPQGKRLKNTPPYTVLGLIGILVSAFLYFYFSSAPLFMPILMGLFIVAIIIRLLFSKKF